MAGLRRHRRPAARAPGPPGRGQATPAARGPARAQTLPGPALRTALESLLISVADRAAEDSVSRWRNLPAGAALLDQLAAADDGDGWGGSQFAADCRADLRP